MKQIKLLLMLGILINWSCHKSDNNGLPENGVKSKISNWLVAEQKRATPEKSQKIQELARYLDYDRIYTEDHYGGMKFIVVPVKSGYKMINNKDKNPLNHLLLTIDANGAIKYGKIMQFVPETGLTPEKLPENTFHDMSNGGEVKVNGSFRATSVGDRFMSETEYKDGKMVKSNWMKKEEANITGRTGQYCIDWYIVTTFYVNGEVVSQTSEYIGQTCYGCDPYAASLEDLDCGANTGGGGGGGGGNTDPGSVPTPPEPVSKQVSWVVKADVIAGWNVKSYEQLNGLKPLAPELPIFTSINHQNDAIFNTVQPSSSFYTAWQKLAVTTNVTSGGGAGSSTVAGKVANIIDGEKEISNASTWLAANEF
jgi:hypothetical protein